MSDPWCYFKCNYRLATLWHEPVIALGGTVQRGHRPEDGVDTSTWTPADWAIWELGGYADVDSNAYGVFSFRRTEDSELLVSAISEKPLLLMFKAAGAYNFSCEKWLNSHCKKHWLLRMEIYSYSTKHWLLRVPLAFAVSWPDALRGCEIEIESYWPDSEDGRRRQYKFPVGVCREGAREYRVFAGLTINVSDASLIGFLHVLQIRDRARTRRHSPDEPTGMLERFISTSI